MIVIKFSQDDFGQTEDDLDYGQIPCIFNEIAAS